MVISVKNLTTVIDCCLPTAEAGSSKCCQLEGAQNILQNNVVYSVPTLADLPDPSANEGRFIYVDDINEYRYSNCYAWTADFDTTVEAYANVLWTWGSNTAGQLGDGTIVSRLTPGLTSGTGDNWSRTSSSNSEHTMALKTDGTVWTWGCNGDGRLGDNSTTTRSSPVTTAGGGTTWCQISAGYRHSAAVKTDGTLWTWGRNTVGQLGDGTTVIKSSPVTTAGDDATWRQVSGGRYHTAAVKTDGTLWTWGFNSTGQLGDNSTVARSSPVTTAGGGTTWCQVSGGRYHTAGVKTDGTLWTWGFNSTGQLGTGTTVNRSSPGTTAGGGTTWCQVSGGNLHMAAIKTDGTLWTWGAGTNGRLGNGDISNRSSPVTTIGGGTTWCQVSAGAASTAAVKTDGTLWTWGSNASGALGIGSTTSSNSPVLVFGDKNTWCQVSIGAYSTSAISVEIKGFNAI